MHLCNRCVRELLILARTWFAFGLPSEIGVRHSDCLVFTVADDVGAAMVPGVIIMATSTLGLRSLGLGATRRIVPCGMSAYSVLVR
jgi:hypothetical protein